MRKLVVLAAIALAILAATCGNAGFYWGGGHGSGATAPYNGGDRAGHWSFSDGH